MSNLRPEKKKTGERELLYRNAMHYAAKSSFFIFFSNFNLCHICFGSIEAVFGALIQSQDGRIPKLKEKEKFPVSNVSLFTASNEIQI